jgi:uncharacterized protein (DUF2062 family)
MAGIINFQLIKVVDISEQLTVYQLPKKSFIRGVRYLVLPRLYFLVIIPEAT